MNQQIFIFLISPLVLLNLVAFSAMVWDKTQSRKTGARRISEGALFFWAIIFGGIGIYFGMWILRHKTRKWYFFLGIPLLILENIACGYVMYGYLEKWL